MCLHHCYKASPSLVPVSEHCRPYIIWQRGCRSPSLLIWAETFNHHCWTLLPNSEQVEVSTHTTSPISPSAQLHSGFRVESCSRKPQVIHERCISDTFHTYKAIAQGYLLFRQKEGCYPAELASGNINANSFYIQNSGKQSPFHLERSAISLKCRTDHAGKCTCCRISRKLGFY